MKKRPKIVADPKYGYLHIDSIPTQEEVERFYLKDFYSSTHKQLNDSSLKVQKEEQDFFNSHWETIFNRCSDYFKTHKGLTLFDVGCGFGQALLYFYSKGIKVSGLEPSKEGAEYIKSKGLKVFQRGIEDFPCKERFDIVTLLNVLNICPIQPRRS